MNLNKRQFLKGILTGGVLGVAGTEIVKPVGEKIHGIITGEGFQLTVDDLVHGKGKTRLPSETHEALVESIARELGAPERNIHALLTQERPPHQKTDFYLGESFGSDSGKPTILFERHTFWQALERKGRELGISGTLDLPTLVFRSEKHDGSLLSKTGYGSSNEFKYGKYAAQYPKLRTTFDWGAKHARALADQTRVPADTIQTAIEDASLMACSWGGGQILGKNYADLGYDSVRDLAQNATTVAGMTENFVRFVKNHKGLKHNGRIKRYLTEIRKPKPDWTVIGMCHNGESVRSVNPDYISNTEKYAKQYGRNWVPDGYAVDALAGATAGAAAAAGIAVMQKNLMKGNPKTVINKTRRNFLKTVGLGAAGGVAARAASQISHILGIDWKMIRQSKKETKKEFHIQDAFEENITLPTPKVPTKIQTKILNPWLELNKDSVKRFTTIEEAQKDSHIVQIEPKTNEYRCEGLGSMLLKTLKRRHNKNSDDYLYMHRTALTELGIIAKSLEEKAQEVLGMKSGYQIRLIITSALRDGSYSQKYLANSSPNSTHNTGRAFDIAERFDLITPEGQVIDVNSRSGILWSNLRALLVETLNERDKKEIYYMREGIPPHFHCVAIGGTKRTLSK